MESEDGDPRFGMQAPVGTALDVSTPGGLTADIDDDRTVTLGDPTEPLSPETQTDTVTVNGRAITRRYDAAMLTRDPVNGLLAATSIDDAAGSTVTDSLTHDTFGELLSYGAQRDDARV